jgi:hypothetical protein
MAVITASSSLIGKRPPSPKPTAGQRRQISVHKTLEDLSMIGGEQTSEHMDDHKLPSGLRSAKRPVLSVRRPAVEIEAHLAVGESVETSR